MITHLVTIAVVSSSPALASVLSAAMRHRPGWRVRSFSTLRELGTYMRIAPVRVVVSDYALADGTISDFAFSVRHGDLVTNDALAILALARIVTPEMRRQCLSSGVDEMIVKPMSPAYIQERVAAHLERKRPAAMTRGPGSYAGPDRRGRIALADSRKVPTDRRGSNVISFAAHKAARDGAELPRA